MCISRRNITNNLPSLILGDNIIEFVDKAPNLGVIFQNDLEWDNHINAQCRKIYSGLRFLRLS